MAVREAESTAGAVPATPVAQTSAPSADPTSVPSASPAIRIAIPKKSEIKHPKASSAINSLIDRVESGEITAEEAAKEAPLHQGESVGVIILLSGNVDGLVTFLEANGASNINAGEDYIEAYVPILLLGRTSEQPGVLRVDQIQLPGETQGTPQVIGQGPGVHNSKAWNDAGYSGQGIKVGVIDRGFRGFEDIMGSEVPAAVEARCYTRLLEYTQTLADCSDGGTHGTDVSESLMDIAPEAALYISDPRSPAELQDAVDWMISEGVSVINHSMMKQFDGPGDGTSPSSVSPLNSIDRAVAAGIVWVNAAGNQARGTWFQRGPFDYTTVDVDGEEARFLRFSGSEFKNRDSYIGGKLELRWEDEWGGADTDLDLFALVSGTDRIALQSIDLQTGEAWHNPLEWVGSIATFDIVIAHRSGPQPDWIQLFGWGPSRLKLNSSGAGSIANPAESANPGMLAVGAAPWYNINVLSNFSSRGPTPDGRIKPDVVAANCGETATGGEGFCGTSQASPHVAGMAALVRQRFPSYSPAQVVSYLKDNAEQRVSTPDPNNSWGHGLFVLPPFTQAPQPMPTTPGAPAISSVTPGTNSLTVAWRAPLQTGDAPVTTYDLRHIRSNAPSKANANWTVSKGVWAGSGTLAHDLTDLTGGVRYDVQLRAVNSAGEGPWSSTRTATPVSALAVPGAPIFVSVSPGEGSLTVVWNPPTSDGGSPLSAWELRRIRSDMTSKADGNWTVARGAWTGSGSMSHTLTGLAGGTQHDVQVRAVNAVGEGPWSATRTETPLQSGPACSADGAVPNAATNRGLLSDCEILLAVRDTLAGSGTLNWSSSIPIANWTGVIVRGTPQRVTWLHLHRRVLTGRIPPELGGLTGLNQLDLSYNQLTGTIPTALGSLTNLTALNLFVNRLAGPIPAELGRLTKLQALELWDNQLTGPIPPELGSLTNLQALHLNGNQLTGEIPPELGRLINLRALTLHDNQLMGKIPSDLVRLTNLERLFLSGNRFGDCVPAELRSITFIDRTTRRTEIGIPYCDVLLSGLTIGSATLTPQFNSYTTGYTAAASRSPITVSPISRQNATFEYLDAADKLLADADSTEAGHQVDVPADRVTSIKVKVLSQDGKVNRVYAIQITGPGALGAPVVNTPTAAGMGSLTVSWVPPSQTGGSSITAYHLRHIRNDSSSKNDADWTVEQDVWTGSGPLQYVLTGLTNGTRYDVQVRAVNVSGDGPWSAKATGTTAATTPGVPTGLTATANGERQIDLSWTAPSGNGGASITGYRIETSSDGWIWTALVANTRLSGTTYAHTGLTAGDTRHYRVSAINSAGAGPPSNVAEASTGAASAPDLAVDRPTLSESAPPGRRRTLHAEHHGAQPGQRGIGVHDTALLPVYRPGDHHRRHGGRPLHGLTCATVRNRLHGVHDTALLPIQRRGNPRRRHGGRYGLRVPP